MRTSSGQRLPCSAAAPHAAPGEQTASFCHLKHCADCVRHALARDIGQQFKELTGLQLHLLRGTDAAAACPEIERLRVGNGSIPPRCALCAEHIWQVTSHEDADGRVFTGACGRLNCRLSIRTADGCALNLVIQTPDPKAGVPGPSGMALQPVTGLDKAPGPASAGRDEDQAALQPGGDCVPGANGFGQAGTLLKIVARGLEALLEAEELKWALSEAQRVWQAALAGDNRLRQALGKRLPELLGETVGPEISPQADRLVERVRDFLLQNYRCPAIGLGDAAACVHRSASYISTLFARAAGISFHSYLQELRLTKARELLRDPSLTVAEVAAASGYASADWFRHSFKHHLGLSPSDWRRSHCLA